MHIVDLIYFNQIFEKHENVVAEQTCLSAEVRVLELREDLSHKSVKVSIVLKYLTGGEGANILRNLTHRLGQDISFIIDLNIKLQIIRVCFTDLRVHLDIVLGLIFTARGVAMK